MTIKHFLRTVFFSFLCINMTCAYAMFNDTYDYYDQLDIDISLPQNKVLSAFTKKIKPYFDLLGPKENYKGKNLRERLIAYDNEHGTPHLHKLYDKDKKAFDVLNNFAQRKAYDAHKGYDGPEPKVPTEYHAEWCTGYCKKYLHKIDTIDKEKQVGKKMLLACGHELCILCARFDPNNKYEGDGDRCSCPFGMPMPDCHCSICPYTLEKHLVGDHKRACPSCATPITNVGGIRQELMKNMWVQDRFYYMLPPALRPFATKWHFGLALTGMLTAQYVHYFNKKAQLHNQFDALEHAADLAVTSLLSLEFEQFDDINILGLQERFDIEKLVVALKSDELKARLICKIANFDMALKSVYDTICARYYYNTVEIFIRSEPGLIAALNASLVALKEDINASRAALGITKTIISPRLKSIAGLCVGGVTGLYVWSNIR